MTSTQEQVLSPEVKTSFEKYLKDRDIQNYSIKISSGAEEGQNFVGLIARAVVSGYNNKGNKVEYSFVIKCASRNEETRNARQIRQAFLREIYIYSKVFREFDLIQQEKCVVNPFKSYPEYYTSTSQDGKESIIQQDLKPYGYKHWDREIPVDFNHASLVLREYGRLHALSFAIRNQKPQIFEDFIENTHNYYHNFSDEGVRFLTKNRVEQALELLDPVENKSVYNKLQEFSENMFEVLSNCTHFKAAGQYGVVAHVDCSLSNLMFNYENLQNLNKPTNIRILDWQLSFLGSPAIDLSTFLFSSTDKKLRDEHYHDLIAEYYNSFCSMLKKLEVDAQEMLPFTVLQEHLKKFSVFGFIMALLLVFIQLMKKEEISDVLNNTSEFNLNDETFKVRIRDIILDFDEFGYNFHFD